MTYPFKALEIPAVTFVKKFPESPVSDLCRSIGADKDPDYIIRISGNHVEIGYQSDPNWCIK